MGRGDCCIFIVVFMWLLGIISAYVINDLYENNGATVKMVLNEFWKIQWNYFFKDVRKILSI